MIQKEVSYEKREKEKHRLEGESKTDANTVTDIIPHVKGNIKREI